MKTAGETLARAAHRVGENRKGYGEPSDLFIYLAGSLTALGYQFRGGPLKPRHLAMLMVNLKVARELAGHNWDNLVDIAGYAGCTAELPDE